MLLTVESESEVRAGEELRGMILTWSADSIEITKHWVSASYVAHRVQTLWGPVHEGTEGTIDVIWY